MKITSMMSLTLLFILFATLVYFTSKSKSVNFFSANISPESRQLLNVQWLESIGQIQRVIPHRVDTLGKFNDIFSAGYRSFEIDLIFRNNETEPFFEIGHDEATKTGVKLSDFLNTIPISEIKKIWFDVKNLDENNVHELKKTLIALDERFNLKGKIIFESSTTSPTLSEISDEGFHVSYYLPTAKLKVLLREKNNKNLNREAKRISAQISKQRVSAVSFHAGLYPFVKDWLEKQIPKNIVYHTYHLRLRLNRKNFIKRIQREKYFHDSRVQTILVPFKSIGG